MNQKLLACDIDGTLLINKQLSEENIQAIKEFRNAGHLFVLCSGRTPSRVQEVFDRFPNLDCDGAIVAGGGALYSKKGSQFTPIEQNFLDSSSFVEIIAFVRDHYPDFTIHWSNGEENFSLPERYPPHDGEKIPQYVTLKQWITLKKESLMIVFSSIHEDEAATITLKKAIHQQWGHSIEAHHNNHYLDISAKGCNKKYGTLQMQKITNAQLYAVGDGLNDIPMFEGTGKEYSFLIESGSPELKPLVSRTVKSVAECIHILLNS